MAQARALYGVELEQGSIDPTLPATHLMQQRRVLWEQEGLPSLRSLIAQQPSDNHASPK